MPTSQTQIADSGDSCNNDSDSSERDNNEECDSHGTHANPLDALDQDEDVVRVAEEVQEEILEFISDSASKNLLFFKREKSIIVWWPWADESEQRFVHKVKEKWILTI